MAIAQGNVIYASEVNAVNNNASLSGTLSAGADWIQNSIGNDGVVWCHRSAGQRLFEASMTCGIFGGGKFRIKKFVNGGWNETIYSKDYGWNANDNAKVNSTGPAAYRIYSETAFAMNAISWRIYCAQNDCTAGKRIVCWDGFQNTLNKVNTGQPITAALANQQRLGYE